MGPMRVQPNAVPNDTVPTVLLHMFLLDCVFKLLGNTFATAGD